jgi:hypothetical protein
MFRSAVICAAIAAMAGALCAAPAGNAVAQSQMQGQIIGSPGPMGDSPDKPKSTKQMRADCTTKGKSQGLKGRDLTNFVTDCVKNPM